MGFHMRREGMWRTIIELWKSKFEYRKKQSDLFFLTEALTCDLGTGHDSGFLHSVKSGFLTGHLDLGIRFSICLWTQKCNSLFSVPPCAMMSSGVSAELSSQIFKGFRFRGSVPALLPWFFLVLPHAESFAASSCCEQKIKDLSAHLGRRHWSTFLPM